MASLGRWCVRHRDAVLIGWLLALIALTGVAHVVGTSFKDTFSLPASDSQQALDLLRTEFPALAGDVDTIVLHARSGSIADQSSAIHAVLDKVARLPHVAVIDGPFTSAGALKPTQVSRDGTTAYAALHFDDQPSAMPASAIKNVISAARAGETSALQVELGGNAIGYVGQSPPSTSEFVGVLAAGVVLFLTFGSLVSMLLPLVAAAFALLVGTALITLLSHTMSVASFSPTLAMLVGLGVGVDYALFIVTRHRSGLRRGLSVEDAAATAISTAGRAVLFAGVTVAIALLGMFAVGINFLYGAAVSSTIIVIATVVAALTLLPAMLGFLGMRVLSKKDRVALALDARIIEQPSGFWHRWSRLLERHTLVLAAVAAIVLIVLAIPFASLRLGASDQGNGDSSQTTRRAYDLMAGGFGAGFAGPLQVVTTTSKARVDQAELSRVAEALSTTPDVASVGPAVVSPRGTTAVFSVIPDHSPQSAQTAALVHRLRDTVLPAAVTGGHLTAHVGGATAIFDDFSSAVQRKLPLFIGVVVLLAFLLLLMVFRSILIPLTASVMNLLAAGAALGVTVAVFQWGWGENVIGLGRTGPIEAFVPVMLFAILFGLSMDYEVFLVSRIQEEWLESRDNTSAVAKGQAETGRVITAAAAIMVLVFLSFVLGGDRVIKVFGLGLAVAVAIDALLIRTILVPAVMLVLGRANWWLPKGLGRFVPHLDIEGAHAALPQPTAFAHPATAPGLLPEQRELEPDLVSIG